MHRCTLWLSAFTPWILGDIIRLYCFAEGYEISTSFYWYRFARQPAQIKFAEAGEGNPVRDPLSSEYWLATHTTRKRSIYVHDSSTPNSTQVADDYRLNLTLLTWLFHLGDSHRYTEKANRDCYQHGHSCSSSYVFIVCSVRCPQHLFSM